MATETGIAKDIASISLEELTALRKDAEGHLKKAQDALFDDNVSDDDALSHLDAALACVNSMITPKHDSRDERAA